MSEKDTSGKIGRRAFMVRYSTLLMTAGLYPAAARRSRDQASTTLLAVSCSQDDNPCKFDPDEHDQIRQIDRRNATLLASAYVIATGLLGIATLKNLHTLIDRGVNDGSYDFADEEV